MTATTHSTALVTIQPVFTDAERLALAGFLAGYRGLTREAYTLDLRQFTAWCSTRSLSLFAVRRADIETFARDLEANGRARATVTRRLCTIAGFYKYAVEEELLEHSPAAHVRRPRLDYESHATALDRNELGALLVAAGLGPPAEHSLISLLALNGLRVSEATGAESSSWAWNAGTAPWSSPARGARSSPSRWHRAPPGRSISLSASALKGRCSWLGMAGGWTGTALPGSSAGSPAVPGLGKHVSPTRSGMHSSPRRSTPGSRCATSRTLPPTPTREPRCGTTGPAPASTGTPPTSSRRLSREQPDNPSPRISLVISERPGRPQGTRELARRAAYLRSPFWERPEITRFRGNAADEVDRPVPQQ